MKNIFRICVILGLIASMILFGVPVLAAGQGNTQDCAPDHILVKFNAGIAENAEQEVHNRQGGIKIGEIAQLGIDVVRIPTGKVKEKVNSYRSEKAVAFAEPDYVAKAIGTPNDPSFVSQWGLTQIKAPQAWDVTTGASSIKIAILDTGVDQDHPDLIGKIVANKNFTSSGTFDDLYGHGTHCAGIAAAATNNGIGVSGAGYNSTILNGKVLDDTGSGYYSWIINGINWAADNGAKVISMSLGGSSGSTFLRNAIDNAWNKGVVVVAAAGNNGSSAASYPAYYSNCIAVAATGTNDAKASWSNYGSWVDVAAPGVNILSTLPNQANQMGAQNYGSLSGTSMATPFVAGEAALIWSTSYGTSASRVRYQIESTADQIAGTGSTYGRINAFNAVTEAVPAPDFSLSALPASQAVLQGVSTQYNIAITPTNGFASQVNLSVSGLPSGASGTFNPASATNSSVLTVTTAFGTPVGSYSLAITGVAGSITRTTSTTLIVNAAGSFTLNASPLTRTIVRGLSTTYSVTVVPSGGFSAPVSLTVSGLPSRSTGSFNPNPATGVSTLTVRTSSRSPTGTFPLTIKGTGGGITAQTTVTLVLTR